jgi:hypothetical protein
MDRPRINVFEGANTALSSRSQHLLFTEVRKFFFFIGLADNNLFYEHNARSGGTDSRPPPLLLERMI